MKLRNTLTFGAILLFSQTANAILDDLENKLRHEEAVQLRWDNVEGTPYWVAGPQTSFDPCHGMHVVSLTKTSPVIIRLTKRSYLRIHNPNGNLKPTDVEVLVSNGSGLFLSQQPMVSGNNLILPPISHDGGLVKVTLTKSNPLKSAPIAFFLSRYETPSPMAPYRRLLGDLENWAPLVSNSTDVPQSSYLSSFDKLSPDSPMLIEVEGPARLNLMSHLIYGSLDNIHPFMYRIDTQMDGVPFHTAEFIGRAEQGKVYYEDFKPLLLSYSEISPMEIPCGTHTLKLTSNAPLYFQLQKLEAPGYFIPAINSPDLKNRPLPPNTSSLELSHLDLSFAKQPSHTSQLALKFAKDNVWKSSGGKGVYILEDLSLQRPDALDLNQERQKVSGLVMFYRSLLPTKGIDNKKQKRAWTNEWLVRDPEDEGKLTYALKSQKEFLLNYLQNITFFSTSTNPSEALTYTLPERASPSYFRILVNSIDIKNQQTIWVQFDDKKPQKLELISYKNLSKDAYLPNRGVTGLSLLGDPEGTLGGIFASSHVPAPFIPTSSSEIPLPADVKEVRVWSDTPLEVAAQFQTSSPYRLQHNMMLQELKKVDNPATLFLEALRFVESFQTKKIASEDSNVFWSSLKGRPLDQKQPTIELYNHWLPLLRLLTFRKLTLKAGYEKVDDIFVSPRPSVTSDLSAKLNSAEAFMNKGQFQEAVEAWTDLLNSSNKDHWRRAHLGRITALQQLGETYLSERYLRALFLNAQDEELQDKAFIELYSLYKGEEDYFSLEGLLSTNAVRTSESKYLYHLSKALVADQFEQEAIDLAHVLKDIHPQPDDLVIFAALRNNRAKQGGRLGEATESNEERAFWKGQLAQADGNYEAALNYFEKAGELGKPWRDSLLKGIEIRKRLYSPQMKLRQSAIQDWMKWENEQPSPKIWRSATHLVESAYQSATLFSRVIDKVNATYTASAKAPLKLKVIGPTQLQLQVRVIFTENTPIPFQGWLDIRDNGKNTHYPITNTTPSEGIKLIGPKGQIGLSSYYGLSLDAGEHTIEVSSPDVDLAVEVYQKEPLIHSSILPPVSPNTLNAILAPSKKPSQNECHLEVKIIDEIDDLGAFKTISADPDQFYNIQQAQSKDLSTTIDDLTKSPSSIKPPLPHNEQVLHELSDLLWQYENHPSQALLIKAHNILENNKQSPALSRLWNRFTTRSHWVPVKIAQKSAGIRTIASTDSWEPGSQESQLRKELLDTPPENFVVTTHNPLVFQFYNAQPTQIKLEAALSKLITDDLDTIHFAYQIDDKKAQFLPLTPSNRSQLKEIMIPEGEHSLRFFVKDPIRDVFIDLKLKERLKGSSDWKSIKVDNEKDYLVATKEDNVEIDIVGPAWLRIDEWVNGNVLSKEVILKPGQQRLTLGPSGKRSEGLYKVYQRVIKEPSQIHQRLPRSAENVEVMNSPLAFNAFEKKSPITGEEVLPLGGQEDGTLSVTASFNRVLGFAQGNLEGIQIVPATSSVLLDKFAEQRATYRYFDNLNRIYWKTDGLIRERKHGNPTLGISAQADYVPIAWPLTLWGKVEGFSQRFKGQNLYSGTVQGGVRNKLTFSEKADHRMNLSILGRKLHYRTASLQPLNTNLIPTILPDRDVFSRYLATHKRALQYSYKFIYRPFIDTRLRAELLDISNPNLNLFKPDSLSGSVGVDQLIGSFILSLGYTRTHFYSNLKQTNLIPNRPQTMFTVIRAFPFNRNEISAALSWNHWLKNHNRIECRFEATRVYDTQRPVINGVKSPGVKDWVGFFSLTWHFGNGRDFRDFYPEDILFRNVRERYLPPVQVKQTGAGE